MIPKIIHYCWFGRNPLPKSALKCIESWKKFCPGYEIKEWNEDNFDINIIPYTKEAYEAKKYAFVSDYARFWILYHYGGVYFDTDVQVIKPLDEIVAKGPFMAREAGAYIKNFMNYKGESLAVAPGLGIGAEPGMPLYKEFLDGYKDFQFKNSDGTLNTKTVCEYTVEILLRHGLNDNNDTIEKIDGVYIYPVDYFCPMDHTRGNELKLTHRTVSIHLYDCSWMDHNTLSYKTHQLKILLMKVFGVDRISKIANYIKRR